MINGTPLSGTRSPRPHRRLGVAPAAPQALAALGPHEPVLYAWDLAGPGAKERLVRRLLAGLPGRETPAAVPPITLETSALGQPRLRLRGQPGPSVSFSQAAGRLWAALAPVGQIGVDVALPGEFEASYPWSRAFGAPELAWARRLTGGDTASAAALLWALKEAAVKALGVGFHLLDPLAVAAVNPEPWQEWVRVSLKAGEQSLPAWTRPAAGGWLALARNY